MINILVKTSCGKVFRSPGDLLNFLMEKGVSLEDAFFSMEVLYLDEVEHQVIEDLVLLPLFPDVEGDAPYVHA